MPGDPFSCPRCHRDVAERFYGPCASCRSELVAALGGEGRQLDEVLFEPRANVVANHVATKD